MKVQLDKSKYSTLGRSSCLVLVQWMKGQPRTVNPCLFKRSVSGTGTGFGAKLLETRNDHVHHVFSYIVHVHVPMQDMATLSSERAQLSFESASCDEHEPPMPCSFSVGEVFTSYEDLQTKVSLFEKQTFVKLWKRQ